MRSIRKETVKFDWIWPLDLAILPWTWTAALATQPGVYRVFTTLWIMAIRSNMFASFEQKMPYKVEFRVLAAADCSAFSAVRVRNDNALLGCAPWVKNQGTVLLSVTSPNVDRFSNSFTIRLCRKFVTKIYLNTAPHPKRVATLPCEISRFNNRSS